MTFTASMFKKLTVTQYMFVDFCTEPIRIEGRTQKKNSRSKITFTPLSKVWISLH
jgi:hypothetical protein